MNRADLLWSVLKDGRPHSRQEIFEQVGYMLTNNAASELRARGVLVEHRREGRLDVYEIVGSLREPALPPGASPSPVPELAVSGGQISSPAGSRSERDALASAVADGQVPLQLSIEEAA